MDQTEGTVNRKMESLSLEISSCPRDLLARLGGGSHKKKRRATGEEEGSESEEIELSLGLSLGGRFGVDKLVRSSSIPERRVVESSYPLLTRTSSLPAETEEEWMKRKQMQSFTTKQATKRRRTEKQSDHSSKMVQGSRNGGESNSHTSNQSSQDQRSQAGCCPPVTKTRQNPGRILTYSSEDKKRGKGVAVEDMPCVFTVGDSPNGRRVEGILYKYGRGKEVRIMCVCHGSFLSPAEFVEHAGGTNVDHPLRHIVVSPSFL